MREGPGPVQIWLGEIFTRHRRSLCICLLTAVLVSSGMIGAAVGLKRMQQFVLQRPQYAQSFARVELAEKPEWIGPWLEQTLCHEFLENEEGEPWTYDEGLARRIHAAAARCPWVRELHEVRIDRTRGATDREYSQGVIRISAEWRKPAAIAAGRNGAEEFVDDEGVVLPKDQVGAANWLPRIHGVRSMPSRPGERWEGQDLQAGLAMVKRLREQPYFGEITVIDVENHDNRRNIQDPAIRLYAEARGESTEIRYGRLPQGAPIGEPTNERKLGYLADYFARNGTLVGRKYLELRRSDNLYVSSN